MTLPKNTMLPAANSWRLGSSPSWGRWSGDHRPHLLRQPPGLCHLPLPLQGLCLAKDASQFLFSFAAVQAVRRPRPGSGACERGCRASSAWGCPGLAVSSSCLRQQQVILSGARSAPARLSCLTCGVTTTHQWLKSESQITLLIPSPSLHIQRGFCS